MMLLDRNAKAERWRFSGGIRGRARSVTDYNVLSVSVSLSGILKQPLIFFRRLHTPPKVPRGALSQIVLPLFGFVIISFGLSLFNQHIP